MATNKEVAKKPDVNAVVLSEDRPDWVKTEKSNRGSENVSTSDLIIPRLEQCQSISPCRKKDGPAYIPGIEDGDLYNNITRQIYGPEVLIVPVFYRKEWIIWKDRDAGGGFRGVFATKEDAERALPGLEDADDCDVADVAQHFSLLVDPTTGKTEELVVSMARSKLKVSRTLNSLIRMNEGDSFSRVYRLRSISDKNQKNQDYYNFTVSAAGFPSKAIYKQAEELYYSIVAGERIIDRATDSDLAEGAINAESEY